MGCRDGRDDEVPREDQTDGAGRLFDGVGLGSSVADGDEQCLSLQWGADNVDVGIVIYHIRIKFSGPKLQLKPFYLGGKQRREPGVYVGVSAPLRRWLNWGVGVFPGVNYTKVRSERLR